MKTRHLLIIVFAILPCVLIMDDLVPQLVMSRDSNLVYAQIPPGPPSPVPPGPPSPVPPVPVPNPRRPVPEPSTLLLLGTGAAGRTALGGVGAGLIGALGTDEATWRRWTETDALLVTDRASSDGRASHNGVRIAACVRRSPP